MTFADRLAEALIDHGPLPLCLLAREVCKRDDDVRAELERHPDRFVHNGLKARAARWDVHDREAETAALARAIVEDAEEDYRRWWLVRFGAGINGEPVEEYVRRHGLPRGLRTIVAGLGSALDEPLVGPAA